LGLERAAAAFGFHKHTAHLKADLPLDRARWSSLEQRRFDVDYRLDIFERSIAVISCGD
jgi:hypothetical protein